MYKIVDFTDEEMQDYVRTVSRQRVHQMLTSMLVGCELHTRLLAAKDFVKAETKAGRFPENKAAKVRVQQASKQAEACLEMQSQSYKDSVPIEGYGDYRVSKDGRVWSDQSLCWLVGGVSISGQGYRTVNLSKEGEYRTFFVHRLVAQAFIPNPENKRTVNHIDGDAKNNKVGNLEWATYKENTRHAIDTGLWRPGKLTQTEVAEAKVLLAKGHTYKEVGEKFGVSSGAIGYLSRGQTHNRGGATPVTRFPVKRLTDDEKSTIRLMKDDFTRADIARKLGRNVNTIYTYIEKLRSA